MEDKKNSQVDIEEIRGNQKERSLFVFAKLRISDNEIDSRDYEMYQLKWKREVQKALEALKDVRVKFVTVSS
jgi:hypothetical protein